MSMVSKMNFSRWLQKNLALRAVVLIVLPFQRCLLMLFFAFARLAIMDVTENANQPMETDRGTVLICNGRFIITRS